MPFAPPARTTGAIRQEKEARLKAFIARHLETLHASGTAPAETTYRLFALSAEGPPARALHELAPELAAARVAVEIVVLRRPSSQDAATLAFAECRVVTDARLLDAHEQLVLDAGTVWIGDCMRRDPTRRDTYELYSNCPATARHAARSFAQIWRAAGLAGNRSAAPKLNSLPLPSLFDPALIAGTDAPPAPGTTLRH